MNVIVLLLRVCLAAHPGQCGERQIPLLPEITAIQCTMGGQFAVAEWSRQHPWFLVRRWRCADAALLRRESGI